MNTDAIKSVCVAIISGVMAYLNPIASNVFAMAYLTLLNFVIGLLVSLLVENESFSWRKFGWCGVEVLIFFAIIASIYIVGHAQGNPAEAIQCVSMVVYAMCYFYSVRILRNLHKMFPKTTTGHNVIGFLYMILTLEVVKKIPYLKEYLDENENQNRQKVEKEGLHN